MEFRILGPLEITGPDGPIVLGSAKLRSVLALLLIRVGEVVPADRLIDELWEGAPPRSAAGTLQTYISQLRRQLGATFVQSVPGGYRVGLEDHTLDAAEFETALDNLSGTGTTDPDLVVGRLRDALALWRGAALADFTGTHWAAAESARLEGLRQISTEDFVEARLALGEHARLVPELEALVREHPLRERLWGQLMLALYRCGRQADALRAYGQLRALLSEEIGIEPSAELAQLERSILLQESGLDWRPPSPESVTRTLDGATGEGLPSGVVTFLLTDIVGSTAMWDQHPAEMTEAIVAHGELILQTVRAHRGRLLKLRGEGDSTFSVFTRATDAIDAAVDVQRTLQAFSWPEGVDVAVRIGVHTGEAVERDGDYFGTTVNRAARLRGLAGAGEIFVSRATAELVIDQLAAEFELLELGTVSLRGLDRRERVYTLQAPGVTAADRSHFPVESTNLPELLNSFVGRGTELTELRALLVRAARVITITGAGGSGKTRLAVRAASEMVGRFRDGVWLVELAPISEPDHVASTVASTIGVSEQPGRDPLDTVSEALRDLEVLIVLDNCEHLLDSAAQLAERIAQGCRKVRLIATSREPLAIPGEHCLRIPTLASPAADAKPDPDTLLGYDSVRLFMDRAIQHAPNFLLDRGNAAAVASICRTLDGIPLAIELAAARLRSLSPGEINARLDERFHFLTGGSRTALARQQTLRALIDWSFDLLNQYERLALCRLAVFVDGFTIEAAEAVVADGFEIQHSQVFDLIVALVDKSLLVVEPTARGTRYRMLETVRHYAAEQLSRVGEDEMIAAATRHRDHYLAFAEQAAPHLHGPDQIQWLATLDDDHENLRSAITYTLDDPAGVEAGMRFVTYLFASWELTRVRDAFELGMKVLDRPAARAPTRQRAEALVVVAALVVHLGKNNLCLELSTEALTIAEAIGDATLTATALYNRGFALFRLGDLDTATETFERCLLLAREHEDVRGELFAMKGIADVLGELGDEKSLVYYQQALAAARVIGDHRTTALLCTNFAWEQALQGNYDSAEQLTAEAIKLSHELHYNDLIGTGYSNLGAVALRRRDPLTARDRFVETLEHCRRTHSPELTAYALFGSASTAYSIGDEALAATLYGAADATAEPLDTLFESHLRQTRSDQLASIVTTLGPETFETAYQYGRTLSLSDAIELVDDIESPS